MKQSLGPAQQAAADQAIAEIANDEISTEEMDNANADNPDCRDWCASLLAKFGDEPGEFCHANEQECKGCDFCSGVFGEEEEDEEVDWEASNQQQWEAEQQAEMEGESDATPRQQQGGQQEQRLGEDDQSDGPIDDEEIAERKAEAEEGCAHWCKTNAETWPEHKDEQA